jgi:hypothetical protein
VLWLAAITKAGMAARIGPKNGMNSLERSSHAALTRWTADRSVAAAVRVRANLRLCVQLERHSSRQSPRAPPTDMTSTAEAACHVPCYPTNRELTS